MKVRVCTNCNVAEHEYDLIKQSEGFFLCEECNDDYNAYLDENSEAIAAQERYENHLAEY